MTDQEIAKLQTYLRKTFKLKNMSVKKRPKKDDSAEVYIDDEFIGILFQDEDEDDDEPSYQFQMAILGMDLE